MNKNWVRLVVKVIQVANLYSNEYPYEASITGCSFNAAVVLPIQHSFDFFALLKLMRAVSCPFS